MKAYLSIYEKVKKEIVEGSYSYGEKLPSKRTMAADSGVSVITVQHAYELLSEEGYIESRERSGYRVIYRASDFSSSMEASQIVPNRELNRAKESHDNNLVDKQSPASNHYVDAISFNIFAKTMRRVLLDYGEQILIRTPNMGCPELRQELAIYLARNRGIHVEPEQIVVGAGAEYLYSLVAQLLGDQKHVAVENPCYEKIKQVYEAEGFQVDALMLGADGILPEELARTQASILHVTPFHSYPSNVTADISKKREYLKWAGKGKYIVEDNYDSELTVSRRMEDAIFSLTGGERVIYINTFSRTIAPSLRVGYMLLPQELVGLFQEKLGFYSCTVPAFEQYVLAELLRSGDFERHLNRVRRRLRREEAERVEDTEKQ